MSASADLRKRLVATAFDHRPPFVVRARLVAVVDAVLDALRLADPAEVADLLGMEARVDLSHLTDDDQRLWTSFAGDARVRIVRRGGTP